PRTYLAGLALSMDAPDQEFDSRIHVDRYDCLAGMSSGPDAQQLIDEALTDVIDSSEVNLDGLKIRLQTIEKAPCFAARHKSGADLKQFDHKTSPDESVVLSEFAQIYRRSRGRCAGRPGVELMYPTSAEQYRELGGAAAGISISLIGTEQAAIGSAA
ncbi:MAG TPA: hypothetical protein VN961_09325, partial [Streptosporangiaceae bacterium]|nr:hypothetical protein [Streptosporangiaceae bacterium]